ncbi:MAG: DUF4160 domain-containing protein [Dehalococcoidia bacterium]
MPTVLRIGAYRFFFYAGDYGEPRHVHIERESSTAKFWLDPARLQKSSGFSSKELNQIPSRRKSRPLTKKLGGIL